MASPCRVVGFVLRQRLGVCWTMTSTGLSVQRNIDKIASNLVELEAKLKHEQEKFQTYGQDLKDAEKK